MKWYPIIIFNCLLFIVTSSFKCVRKALRTTTIEVTNSSPDDILCFIDPGTGTSIGYAGTKRQVLANKGLYQVEAGQSRRVGLGSYCNEEVWKKINPKTDTITFVFIKRKIFDAYSMEELDQRNDLKDIRVFSRTKIVNDGCKVNYP